MWKDLLLPVSVLLIFKVYKSSQQLYSTIIMNKGNGISLNLQYFQFSKEYISSLLPKNGDYSMNFVLRIKQIKHFMRAIQCE